MATNRELLKKLAISFVPTMIVGLILHKIIKQVLFYQSTATIILFILIGVSFLLIELYLKKRPPVKEVSNLSYRQALLVGIAQSFAVVPGVSRAGAVLICMLLQGYKRDEAAEYSFMLGVPTILASGIFDLYSSREVFVGHMDYVGYLLVGSILAGIVAYAVMRLLVRYLQSHTLALFGWYRIIMGSILLIV